MFFKHNLWHFPILIFPSSQEMSDLFMVHCYRELGRVKQVSWFVLHKQFGFPLCSEVNKFNCVSNHKYTIMSPTHSQRVNIMSEVLWFGTLRMYFIPLFLTTKAWEVYQENTCAISFCYFSVPSVIDHWQGFRAEPLFWASLQVSCTQRELPSLVTHQEFLYCCHSRRLALRHQKCSLAHQNLPPWVSNSGSTALPGSAMDCEQLSKLSWLCFAAQVTKLVLYISGQPIAKADLPSLPYLQDYGMISCLHFQSDVGNLLHFSPFTLAQPVPSSGHNLPHIYMQSIWKR